jgi:hypothetical protein
MSTPLPEQRLEDLDVNKLDAFDQIVMHRQVRWRTMTFFAQGIGSSVV